MSRRKSGKKAGTAQDQAKAEGRAGYGHKEGMKSRTKETSDNLKLNSHHVSVEQNSIVFIGSP